MSLHDSILCNITCYGTLGMAEREAIVAAIGDVETATMLSSNSVPNYWACYGINRQGRSRYYVSCSALPSVLVAGELEEIVALISQQRKHL